MKHIWGLLVYGYADQNCAKLHSLIIWLSLAFVVHLAQGRLRGDPFFAMGDGTQLEEVSPIAFARLVPEKLLISPVFHKGVSFGLLVSSVLWAMCYYPHLSAPLTVCLLSLQLSLMYTYSSVLHHKYHLVCQVLAVYAACFVLLHWSRCSVARGIKFWRLTQFPTWVFSALVVIISLAYVHCGISKLRESGLVWADGIGLQAWTWNTYYHRLNSRPGPLANIIIESSGVASCAATSTLALELGAIVALLSPLGSRIVGLGLIGFHVAIWWTLGIVFSPNVFYLGVVFVLARRNAWFEPLRWNLFGTSQDVLVPYRLSMPV